MNIKLIDFIKVVIDKRIINTKLNTEKKYINVYIFKDDKNNKYINENSISKLFYGISIKKLSKVTWNDSKGNKSQRIRKITHLVELPIQIKGQLCKLYNLEDIYKCFYFYLKDNDLFKKKLVLTNLSKVDMYTKLFTRPFFTSFQIRINDMFAENNYNSLHVNIKPKSHIKYIVTTRYDTVRHKYKNPDNYLQAEAYLKETEEILNLEKCSIFKNTALDLWRDKYYKYSLIDKQVFLSIGNTDIKVKCYCINDKLLVSVDIIKILYQKPWNLLEKTINEKIIINNFIPRFIFDLPINFIDGKYKFIKVFPIEFLQEYINRLIKRFGECKSDSKNSSKLEMFNKLLKEHYLESILLQAIKQENRLVYIPVTLDPIYID